MQEALTQVQSGIAAAEEELKKTKAQPLVTVSIESLIKEAPKPAAVPGKLKRTSLASSLFGGSKKEEPAEPAAAASGAVRKGQGWTDPATVLKVLGVCGPARVCWQRSEPSPCPAVPTLWPLHAAHSCSARAACTIMYIVMYILGHTLASLQPLTKPTLCAASTPAPHSKPATGKAPPPPPPPPGGVRHVGNPGMCNTTSPLTFPNDQKAVRSSQFADLKSRSSARQHCCPWCTCHPECVVGCKMMAAATLMSL